MILVTGPTGSGKTVSLYTGLNILNREDTNISTAEDPAEINLPGVNQVNVNAKVGLTFAAAMRAFLRQDPDVIMVGEIRDLETAEIAIKAAQTGHLVLSTLHTNDAPQTLTRLVDMGVKPYAIATSVSLIIAQRLARRLCNTCKQPLDMPKEALLKEGFTESRRGERDQDLSARRAAGNCTDGYKGRVGIYQVMPVTEAIARIILALGSAVEIGASGREGRRLGSAPCRPGEGQERHDESRGSQQRHDRVTQDGSNTWLPQQPLQSSQSSATSLSLGRHATSAARASRARASRPTSRPCAPNLRRQGIAPSRIRKQTQGRKGRQGQRRRHRGLQPASWPPC